MYLRISILLIILTYVESSLGAANITCEFSNVEGRYTTILSNQTFLLSDKGVKIYGKHMSGKKNSDVLVLNASNNNNNLNTLPSTLLQIFTNLVELRMENCGLKKLEAYSFRYCRMVKKIMFGMDKIDFIETGVFKMCGNLEVLEFNGNEILNIDPQAFKGLLKLKILKMNKCHLQAIASTLFMPLFSLEELHITNNQIENIPKGALHEMNRLRVMNFSDNELITFDSCHVVNKSNLVSVDLSSNNIATLDREFLDNWPNNAALNLESNVCIDKKFGPLGTDKLPMHDVVNFFMNCFKSTNESSSLESESDEESSSEGRKSHKEKSSEINEKLDVKPLQEKTVTNVTKYDDDENAEDMTDSPFDFAKETTTPKIEASESSESSESDESEKMTTSTSTTTAEPTTTVLKKKHMKKNKKNVTTDMPTLPSVTTELPEPSKTTIVLPENIKEEEKIDQLKDYEQASCRFYVDADKNYNCELENVTQQLKRINVEHLEGYCNENVSGVYFRESKLFHVPNVVANTFPELVLLSIEKTNLKVMDDEFIEICGNIREIIARDNKIRRIEKDSFKACEKLVHVDVSKNPIENIEGGVFKTNPKLSITFNNLKILPAQSNTESSEKN